MAGMLTTTDNPYSPYDQWEQWLAFDTGRSYHTCAYLARVVDTALSLSTDNEIESGMETIVAQDPFALYKVVFSSDFKANSDRSQPESRQTVPWLPQ